MFGLILMAPIRCRARSCNATFLQIYSDKETQSNQDIDELEYIFGQTIPLSKQG